MKKIILMILLFPGMKQQAFAQTEKINTPTVADLTFNTVEFKVNHRHIARLEKGGLMYAELYDVADYDLVKDFSSILRELNNDISFYKDSLSGLGTDNVRIDYAITDTSEDRKIRFKRYAADGDVYFKKHGQIAGLKLTQDTIRIKIHSARGDDICCIKMTDGRTGFKMHHSLQVTMVLNNYSDIEDLITESRKIQDILDTMAKASQPRNKKERERNGRYYYTTIFYKPTSEKASKFKIYYGKIENELYPVYYKYGKTFVFYGNIGAGLIRNKIAPSGSFGVEYRKAWIYGKKEYNLWALYASPYFLFEKGADGKYHTYDNWFINFEVGSSYETDYFSTLQTQRFTVGLGYLLNPDKIHFTGVTMKAFANFTLMKGITVSPELIATDNFKSIFPGITVKVF